MEFKRIRWVLHHSIYKYQIQEEVSEKRVTLLSVRSCLNRSRGLHDRVCGFWSFNFNRAFTLLLFFLFGRRSLFFLFISKFMYLKTTTERYR